jgi:Polyketide cyclase / dehydrase and lipid transport
MSSLSTTIEAEVNADQSSAFEYIVPIDLTSIFTGYGPLPAVTGSRDQTGAWDAVGQTRTVQFSDGSSAQEMLTQYEAPRYFSYTLSGFTGTLRLLSTSANGEWWFNRVGLGRTHIKWRYAFNARSVFAIPLLSFIVKVLWRGYMLKALLQAQKQLEREAVK